MKIKSVRYSTVSSVLAVVFVVLIAPVYMLLRIVFNEEILRLPFAMVMQTVYSIPIYFLMVLAFYFLTRALGDYIYITREFMVVKKSPLHLLSFSKKIYFEKIKVVKIKRDRLCIYYNNTVEVVLFDYLSENYKKHLIELLKIRPNKKYEVLQNDSCAGSKNADFTEEQDLYLKFRTNYLKKALGFADLSIVAVYVFGMLVYFTDIFVKVYFSFSYNNNLLIFIFLSILGFYLLIVGINRFFKPKYAVTIVDGVINVSNSLLDRKSVYLDEILRVKFEDKYISLYTADSVTFVRYNLFKKDEADLFVDMLKYKLTVKATELNEDN